MTCIYCNGKTSVTNSRPQKKQNSTWRRRQCQDCKAIFTSVETVDLGTSLIVANGSKHTQPFQRDKLLISVYDSLKHRKTAMQDATALTNTMIGRLTSKNSDAIVSTTSITDVVLQVLEKFDHVAAVHYQAYYG